MAEVSAEAVTIQTEEVDFTFDAEHPEDHTGDDFDFDLGADEEGKVEDHGASVADHDEIGYEDESHAPVTGHDGTADEYAEPQHVNENAAPEHAADGDEIDYEDVDLGATTHTDDHGAAEAGKQEATITYEAEQLNDDIDFGFDTAEDGAAAEIQEEEEEGDEVEEAEGAEEENEQEDEEDEDEEDEDNGQEGVENDDDDSDESGHDYGEEDEADDSPDGVSHDGFGGIDSLEPVYTTDVTVTWGDEVCPLFKSSEGDDPDSFYLEDEEALDFPLSRFLQTIRGSIESYINKGDEIFIRIDELGFEFGETTTEALLNQVTFHNLLALHSTLLKNEDPTESNGVHITLGTRPNCLLRLKDLVGGASTGKGLSAFQKGAHTSPDDSSNDSDDNAAGSDESSANDGAEDEEEEEVEAAEEDEGRAPVSEAGLGLPDATGAADATRVEPGDEAPTEAHSAGDDLDFIDYHDEEMTGGATLEDTTHSAVQAQETEQPQQTDNLQLVGDGENHELDVSANPENPMHDDLDLLVDLDAADGATGQDQDDHGLVNLETDNGLEFIDHEPQHGGQAEPGGGGEHDDFLNLDDDAGNTAEVLAVEAPNAEKTTGDDAEAPLGTSVTATLDNDEIDYEDVDTGASGFGTTETAQNQDIVNPPVEAVPAATAPATAPETAADAGLDEIDWDDEVKNHAPSEATSTPATATGKRGREEGEEQDDELLGDLPDSKRHRTGETPS